MGSLDRISTILRSNVNTQLDQADDPTQILDQLIDEMKDVLGEARGQLDELGAQQAQIEADRGRNAALANDWDAKATAAMRLGSEHLAYEALGRKLDYAKNAKVYATQLAAQTGIVEKLTHDVALLEAKHEGMVRGRETLLVRRRSNARGGLAVRPSSGGKMAVIDAPDGDHAVERELGELRARARAELRSDRSRWDDDGGNATPAESRRESA